LSGVPPSPLEPPTVSVIIATYNRSQTLRHAIQSVYDSSFTDWETIVIGDACTDDTSACVESFGDSRIRFVNLPNRCGDQSGPNNHGVALSHGRYIAFLNHDDLYTPDHLAKCVAELESSGADLVWVSCAMARPRANSGLEGRPCQFVLVGVPQVSGYSPFSFYFASSWVFRRSLADRIGPWPAANRVYVPPSQAWLFRAWRSGATLRFLPVISVIVIPAGLRPGCYARRESPEHEWLASWLKDPKHREHILEESAVSEAMQHVTDLYHAPLRVIRRVLLWPGYALLIALRIHPRSLHNAILYGRRGYLIRRHRRRSDAH